MPSKYRSTRHGRVTKHFCKHFPRFRNCKSRFTTTFYRDTLFKIFSMVIYNTSTEHTILQNALILPHIHGLSSNMVCKWRRVYVTTSQIFITIAPLVLIFEAQSQNLRDALRTSQVSLRQITCESEMDLISVSHVSQEG